MGNKQDNSKANKAKSAWLMAFGDVITLLITFFILVIVLNKGDITRSQKWVEGQLDQNYQVLKTEAQGQFNFVKVHRTSLGIEVDISGSEGFANAGLKVSPQLRAELIRLAGMIKNLPLIQLKPKNFPVAVKKSMKKNDLKWEVEIEVSGYTDNDFVDPYSRLKNNWFLSTMRAQNVMNVLLQTSGLPAALFSVTGYGQYRPIASNKTPQGKAKNRRVEIIITAILESKTL